MLRGKKIVVVLASLIMTGSLCAQSFKTLHSFTGSPDGATPGLLVLSGSTLYGTTSSGGISNRGTIFKINTDGTGYSILKDFLGPEGKSPRGLWLNGDTLYGMATWNARLSTSTTYDS